MLLTCIGQKGRENYETFTFDSADDEIKLKPVLNKFSEYCNPRKGKISPFSAINFSVDGEFHPAKSGVCGYT